MNKAELTFNEREADESGVYVCFVRQTLVHSMIARLINNDSTLDKHRQAHRGRRHREDEKEKNRAAIESPTRDQ